jgi:hypothetical protein
LKSTMAAYSPFQLGTAVLVLVAVLEALVYFWNRHNGAAGAEEEGAVHDLGAGRRLLSLAGGRAAAGNDEAALRICDRARVILAESRRRAVGAGDRRVRALADRELARCTAIRERSRARYLEGQKRRPRAADARLDDGRLQSIEARLDEVERLSISAEEAFAAGNFIDARNLYSRVRERLSEARRSAMQAGSRSYVKLIDAGLERAQRGLASSNAWVLDGRPVFGGGGRSQVKGVISPYFRREDGSFRPRPR